MKHFKLMASISGLALWSATAFAGPAPKVNVCHWHGDTGTFGVINISSNALGQHISNHAAPWGTPDHVVGSFFNDADGDGHGSASSGTNQCQLQGYTPIGDDCNDGDASVYPGAAEACNGVDDDCDGVIPSTEGDADADGYRSCEGDCDDSDATINPGAAEVCNGVDDNCDGSVPGSESDADFDGVLVCQGDCNDNDAGISPLNNESCDGVDNDCDGTTDEGCDSDCPCFSPQTISAAYADHLARAAELDDEFGDGYWYAGAACVDYTVDSSYYYYYWYDYDYTQVYFYTYGYDGQTYHYAEDNYYSLNYNDDYYYYYYDYQYCQAYEYEYEIDYTTGQHIQNTYNYSYQYITQAQHQSCEALIQQWSADNNLACQVYNYTY